MLAVCPPQHPVCVTHRTVFATQHLWKAVRPTGRTFHPASNPLVVVRLPERG